MSLYAISTNELPPRRNMPVPLSLIPFQYALVTAVLLMPPAEVAVPQSVTVGVLAFGPNAPFETPQVLPWMSLWRSVTDVAVTLLLPGALNTPMLLSWMWVFLITVRVVFALAGAGITATPSWKR